MVRSMHATNTTLCAASHDAVCDHGCACLPFLSADTYQVPRQSVLWEGSLQADANYSLHHHTSPSVPQELEQNVFNAMVSMYRTMCELENKRRDLDATIASVKGGPGVEQRIQAMEAQIRALSMASVGTHPPNAHEIHGNPAPAAPATLSYQWNPSVAAQPTLPAGDGQVVGGGVSGAPAWPAASAGGSAEEGPAVHRFGTDVVDEVTMASV